MSAIIKTINPASMDRESMEEAGQIIIKGGLVAFPTETVYGLGGNALDEQAAQKIYTAKGRPSDNPLIVHIADMEHLGKIVEEVPHAARVLAETYWPGPLTMIFRKTDMVPMGTTGGLPSVAVRMPNHPVALELIRRGGGYIAAPSANRSGRPSPTTAAHVMEDLGGTIDMILDGGQVGIGIESTIVDFTEQVPVILRPGYISMEMVSGCIGEVRMDKGLLVDDSKVRPKAPGMKYRHYAPKAPLTIVEGEDSKVVAYINGLIGQEQNRGGIPGVIATDESADKYQGGIVRSIGSRSDEESIALHLYEVLRQFDALGASCIYSEAFHTPKMGQAIMNRLLKASGHRVIEV